MWYVALLRIGCQISCIVFVLLFQLIDTNQEAG